MTSVQAQKITGIWRGYFSAANGIFRDDIGEEMYKYEVQIDQQTDNSVKGVTYSYKSTVFYGKSTMQGIYTVGSKNLILKENNCIISCGSSILIKNIQDFIKRNRSMST